MDNYSLSRIDKKSLPPDATQANDRPAYYDLNRSNQSYLSILGARNSLRGGNSLGNRNVSLSSALGKYYGNDNQNSSATGQQFDSAESTHSLMQDILGKLTNAVSGDDKKAISALVGTLKSAHSSFVSQLRGKSNANENAGLHNNNCGPACLLMIARANGMINGNAANANEQIEYMRQLMGASKDESSLTSTSQLVKGAKALGMNASVDDGGMKNLVNHIKNGKQAILNIRNGGGHAVTVTGMQGDKFIVQDPLTNKPQLVTADQLQSAWGRSSGLMVVIG